MEKIKNLLKRTFELDEEVLDNAAEALMNEFGEEGALKAIESHFNSYESVYEYSEILAGILEDASSKILKLSKEEVKSLETKLYNDTENEIEDYLKSLGWRIVGDLGIGIDLDAVNTKI